MRKTLIAMLFAAALPTLAMADDAPGAPGPGPDQGGPAHGQHQGPFSKLNLTPAQHQQIGQLMRAEMTSRHDISQKYFAKLPAADQKAMQDEMAANRDKSHASIRAILTPDQQKQFDVEVAKMAKRHADNAEFGDWKGKQAAPAPAPQPAQ